MGNSIQNGFNPEDKDEAQNQRQAKKEENKYSGTNDEQETKMESLNTVPSIHSYKKSKLSHKQRRTGFIPSKGDSCATLHYQTRLNIPPVFDGKGRKPFILKALFMLMVLHFLTFIYLFVIYNVPSFKEQFYGEIGAYWCIFGALLCVIAVCFMGFVRCARSQPMNFVFASLAMHGVVLFSGYFMVKYDVKIIIYAFLSTSIIVFFCFVLAFTSIHFTQCLIYVVVATLVVFVCSAVLIILKFAAGEIFTKPQIIIYVVQVLLMSLLLIMQLQSVLTSNDVVLERHEWLAAAVLMYLSVMIIFFKMIKGWREDRRSEAGKTFWNKSWYQTYT